MDTDLTLSVYYERKVSWLTICQWWFTYRSCIWEDTQMTVISYGRLFWHAPAFCHVETPACNRLESFYQHELCKKVYSYSTSLRRYIFVPIYPRLSPSFFVFICLSRLYICTKKRTKIRRHILSCNLYIWWHLVN